MTLETVVPAKLQKIENLMNRAYAVVLEPAEEGGFIVRMPAIPEAHMQGETQYEQGA